MTSFSTFVEVLRHRASGARADRSAYTFLGEDREKLSEVSFTDLDRQARAVAVALARKISPGDRALLLYPPGLEFIVAFLGCLYAGAVAVPAYPPRPNKRADPRLRKLLADAEPRLLMTTRRLSVRIRSRLEELAARHRFQWLLSDALDPESAEVWRSPSLEGDSLAFLQYTSGSTSAPKGVMVTHANLLANQEAIHSAFGMSSESVVVGWLPLHHDMGLIGNVLQPLYAGARCLLMSPATFLKSPRRWLEAITRYRGTTSGGPNFAFEHCLRGIPPERREGLDLRSWNVAFNGAEPVRAATLERFAEAFAPFGFRPEASFPCYGLAEATLFVAGGSDRNPPWSDAFCGSKLELHRVEPVDAGTEDARSLVSCGRPARESRLEIVDPQSCRRCSPGRVGEIWVAGPSVAGGYWGDPSRSAGVFGEEIAGDPSGQAFLRTGDLGFLAGGELYVTGRLKDLIIVRGRNYYPQDVEALAEGSHGAVRPSSAAAFAVDREDGEQVVVVVEREPRRRDDPESIASAVRRAVVEELQLQVSSVVVARAGAVPKTTSGKIRRRACRALYLDGDLEILGRSDLDREPRIAAGPSRSPLLQLLDAAVLEERRPLITAFLRRCLGSVLGLEARQVDVSTPVTSWGLDSLAAVRLRHAIESELGVAPSLAELLDGPSLAELAQRLLARYESGTPPAQPLAAAGRKEFPLSYMQRAIWFHYRMDPKSVSYNVSLAARLGRDVDVDRLAGAFHRLVDRHPALRTTFEAADGEPFQRIRDDLPASFERRSLEGTDEEGLVEQLVAEAHRPFDLETGPVARLVVIELAGRSNLRAMLLVVHHLAVDGWSLWVLLDELRELYCTSSELPELEIDYGDFVRWQQELVDGPRGEELWEFWKHEIGGEMRPLELPLDRPRWSGRSDRGAVQPIQLTREVVRRLRELAQAEGATLYVVLLGAYLALLARHGSRRDPVIGTAVSGRSRPEFEGVVGCLFNAVPIGVDLEKNPSARELISLLQPEVAAALEHQDFPSHLLAERLHPSRSNAHGRFFETLLIHQKLHRFGGELVSGREGGFELRLDCGELGLDVLFLNQLTARAPLELEILEIEDAVVGWFRYSTDVFDGATVEALGAHLENLLGAMAESPDAPLSLLPLPDAGEARDLRGWGLGGQTPEAPVRIDRLLAERARALPDKVAAVRGGRSLTYGELDREADRLAGLLQRSLDRDG